MFRTIAPEYKEIKNVNIITPETLQLDNGIQLYSINSGAHDIIKISLLFKAGSIYQPAPLVAFAANNLLSEGTKRYTSVQISELNDYYGSLISCNTDKDSATITLLVLRKYLDQVLPVLEEIVKYPTYPEQELSTFIGRHSQQFLIEQTKNRNIAHNLFVKSLFGDSHPYGYELKLSDFSNLNPEQLKDFYQGFYHPENCKIVFSGNIQDKDIALINKYFGINWPHNHMVGTPEYFFSESKEYKLYHHKPDSVQSTIRIGKQVCNKLHDDYAGLMIINTILGGYFGSRLMQNIREDKGYTYGINSLLISLRHAGYFTIITDVGTDVTQAALSEIYKEIDRLRNELVPKEELQLVKTQLLSELLRSFDGPFAQADSLMELIEYDSNVDHIEKYIHQIKSINEKKIQELVQQYLDFDRIYEIVVG